MRILLLLLLLISATSYGQILPGSIGASSKPQSTVILDSAQFNFSLTTKTVTGFTNVSGTPDVSVRSATGAYGIGVSTIATARWTPLGNCAADNAGEVGGSTHFPSGVTTNYYFNAAAPDCSAGYTPNIEINGLVSGATYTIYFIGSRLASAVGAANRYMSLACTDNVGDTRTDNYDVKGNTTSIITLTGKVADGSGKIFLLVQAKCAVDGTHAYGYISGLKIKRTA